MRFGPALYLREAVRAHVEFLVMKGAAAPILHVHAEAMNKLLEDAIATG